MGGKISKTRKMAAISAYDFRLGRPLNKSNSSAISPL
jgi:hypothetical protein